MNLTNILTIAAVFLGPITALVIQRELDRRRERDKRQRDLFKTIWATRLFPARLQYPHVQALNMVGIEFEGNGKVVDAWKEYIDFLNKPSPDNEQQPQFFRDRDVKFHSLIFALSQALRYKFSRLEIEKLSYSPNMHDTWAQQDTVLREGVARLFKGQSALPVCLVTNDSVDETTKSPTT